MRGVPAFHLKHLVKFDGLLNLFLLGIFNARLLVVDVRHDSPATLGLLLELPLLLGHE